MIHHLSFFVLERMHRNAEMMPKNETLPPEMPISSGFFPEEIMIHCLVRLPVKSLFRFKAVCKSWKDFISSPGFVEMHLQHSKTNEQLLKVCLDAKEYFPKMSILKLRGDRGSKDADGGARSGNILLPFLPQHFEEVVIDGSCNGLVVLRTKSIPGIVLFNPATRKFRYLSLPVSEVSPLFGLCFISETKDYKIVRVQNLHGERLSSGTLSYPVWVYSLNSDSWKKLDIVFPYIRLQLGQSAMATIFNECMHWMTDEGEGMIAAFDVKNEVFQYMSLPAPEGLVRGLGSVLTTIEGSLSVIVTIRSKNYNLGFEVWKMNEYGVQGSWSKLFSIHDTFQVVEPVGSWKDRRILFKYYSGNDEKVFSYDPSTKKIEQFYISGSLNLQVINYAESMEFVERKTMRSSQTRIIDNPTEAISTVGCTSRGSDSGILSKRVAISGGQDDDSRGENARDQKRDLRILESSSSFVGESSAKGKRKLQ